MDYAVLREKMVNEQLIPRGIKSQGVLEAFRKIERHKFIPEGLRTNAYADFPVSIGEGQTISQPYIVALMTECLNLSGKEKVLEIGTGSGYQTAILAELAAEIYSIERLESLSRKAGVVLGELGYTNIKLNVGDGTLGWPAFAPFDKIIVTAAAPNVPLLLTEQLKEYGLLVLPLGESCSQALTVVEKRENKLEFSQVCGCIFVPLIGRYGYQEGAG